MTGKRCMGLRTLPALLVALCLSALPASAQTGPVLTVDALGRGVFDTNVLRSDERAEGYAGGGDLLVRAANRLHAPTFQFEYAASLRRSTLEDPNSGVGHRVNALAGVPFASWLRLDMIGRGSRGGADEDQVSAGDELMVATRLDLQPVRATRLRGYGAYRWRQMPAADAVFNGEYGGVELRQRIGRSLTLLADARYEEFHGPDSTRDWNRRSIEFSLGQSLFRNIAIEADVRFREREYPERLVEVENAGVQPRIDTDRKYGIALVFDNGTGTEIRLEAEREERMSNDPGRVWQADRATVVVRQRLFALGGSRRDVPRIDERAGTDAIHRAAGREAAAGGFSDVTVAGTGMCGIAPDGALCWPAPSASMAVGTPRFVPGRWHTVEAADGRACALDPAGSVYCWSWPSPLSAGTPGTLAGYQRVRSDLRFADLTVGPAHACALTAEGSAYCWGENADGQLGNDLTRPSATPVAVVGDLRFRTIAAGARHTCALDLTGGVHCWGANESGQSAAGRLRRAFRPTQVDGPAFVSITTGTRHTCALTPDRRAFCWGDNTRGQVGASVPAIAAPPTFVPTDEPLVSIAAGWAHTCALSDAGRAYCWGANTNGQLGTGSIDAESHWQPMRVAGDHTFVAISASLRTCALDSDRQLYCWGGIGQDAAADARAAWPILLSARR